MQTNVLAPNDLNDPKYDPKLKHRILGGISISFTLIGFIIAYVGLFYFGASGTAPVIGLVGLLPHGVYIAVELGLLTASLAKIRTTYSITASAVALTTFGLVAHLITLIIFSLIASNVCIYYYGSPYNLPYYYPYAYSQCVGYRLFVSGMTILTVSHVLLLASSCLEYQRGPKPATNTTIIYVNSPSQQLPQLPPNIPIGQPILMENGQTVMVVLVETLKTTPNVVTETPMKEELPTEIKPPPYAP